MSTKTKALVRRGRPKASPKATAKPRPAKLSRSTALARRDPGRPGPLHVVPWDVLAPPRAKTPAERVEKSLTDEIDLGALGLVELKLTPAEEKVLSEPVNPDDVLIKPSGQPYLSHPAYTRWFNRAFGRLGWAMVPASKPMRSDRTVVQPFVLHVHRKPVAFANGEQEYHETNRDQTYGDALESTIASALRRCAKRLGVGLELWDKPWLDRWIADHAVQVIVEVTREGRKQTRRQWRRTRDPKFWNEIRFTGGEPDEDSQRRRVEYQAEPPRAGERRTRPPDPPHEDGTITGQALTRFWTVARQAKRAESEVKQWLSDIGIASSREIKVSQYEGLVRALQHPGPLGPVEG